MSASERRTSHRKADALSQMEPRETTSITFEWPLRGLRQIFDSSKSDTKSKVIKSTPFGGGRWTVLFYAQSGHEQFCSLYLNAEPLPEERVNPLLTSSSATTDNTSVRDPWAANTRVKSDGSLEEQWARKGLFRFVFNIQTLDDKTVLGTKEAHDHAFSYKTSNWGWAQFAKREHVFYKNADVMREDAFLISVIITACAEKPRIAAPLSHPVPPALVHAMGSLLDDPEHSDVVFYLHASRRQRRKGTGQLRKIYAIRKILASRSEYFRLMFESGFQEGELEETSEEEVDALTRDRRRADTLSSAHPSQAHHAAARAPLADRSSVSPDDPLDDDPTQDELGEDDLPEAILEDSDEEFDEEDYPSLSFASRNIAGSGYHSPNEDYEAYDTHPLGSSEDEDDAVNVTGNDLAPKKANESGAVTPLNNVPHTEPDKSLEALSSTNLAIHASTVTTHSSLSKRERRTREIGVDTPKSFSTQQNRRKRRKVTVMDSAYSTFKALLYFLYTETIDFAPLTSSFLSPHIAADANDDDVFYKRTWHRSGTDKSESTFVEEIHKAHQKRRAVIEKHKDRYPDRPAPCSAKAMYRLADKLDLVDLKRRAQEHIAQSLTINNIVWEVFSGFNTQYKDIRKMETDFLLQHWEEAKRTHAMKSIFLRARAHPGLAEVWPHLLEYLEYKQPDPEDADDANT